ncbi:MAG: potassium-transporting ATPase subunit KdpC [Steroidobacteraceae bacterium]|nr:potassium-transporting ATPase subunit KdpC [Steroidobacteraceae bacterium]
MLKELKRALTIFLALTVVTGLVYPLVTWGIGTLAFPSQVEGSVLEIDGRAVGSRLLGQSFTSPAYFWGRPSATGPVPNNGAVSSGSNQAATNPNLAKSVGERIAALRAAEPTNDRPVPVDLVTASASGLDPHISPAAAEYQLSRVALARGLEPEKVRELVRLHTRGRTFGFLGEPRVDVLQLNVALDEQVARR